MDRLNLRQIQFINLLLNENEFKPIEYFTKFLRVSNKTLKKDLIIIEHYLSGFHIKLDKKHGSGIMIKDVWNAKLVLRDNLNIEKNKDEKISINHRRIEIIKDMLINSHSSTSIQKLADKYYVSKTSIINDFKYIEQWLSSFNLILEKNVEGTKLKGLEVDIRRAIASLLFQYSNNDKNEKNIKELASRLDAVTLNGLSELFEKERIIYVNKLLLDLEKKYNCRIDDIYYMNLITHILISMSRGEEGKSIRIKEEEENFKSKKEYREAILCVDRINKEFKINLGESEVYYLYQYFTSFGLIKEEAKNEDKILNKLDQRAITFRNKLTECIQKILQINIEKDKVVMDKLLLHIRAMLNRMQYNIEISNPLIQDIREQYTTILNICKIASIIVSHDLKEKEVPLDEIGYLALYYQLGLENSSTKRKVLVICHSGYGTSKLLSVKLERHFPQFEIIESTSATRVTNMNLDSIDLIISTVPLSLQNKPYLLVSTFLNEQDIKTISNFLTENKNYKSKVTVETKLIAKYLNEDLIYFNEKKGEVIEGFHKQINKNIIFHEIELNKNLKICISFFNKKDTLGFSINNIENNEKQIVFYIATENTKIMIDLVKEIANFQITEDYASYLTKCKKKEDVKSYFKLNNEGWDNMGVDLKKVVRKETIKLDMKATTKDEALKELTDLLYEAGTISNKEKFLKDVYYRETLGSTGIGNGIAIPHGKSEFVSKTSIAFGKSKSPIKWETLDGEPVHFVILFAVTESDKNSVHVRLLSKVAAKLGDDKACDALLKATTPEKVYDIITGSEED
ncbi:BglG family transcription antiterminator [Clostridium sp. Marseille-Q2269]|uniref:BglG family transcription antiterminator n=1 Tax=Clostridium sp. Marseille-Q2269 TaxID=2942205 RepID=UPI002072E5C9|nr:BglG family transcription antiterminator [Clostridium sp. Marseille-Q2269]